MTKPPLLCDRCQPLALQYADEVSPLDRELNLIASLCEGFGEPSTMSVQEFQELGLLIHRYLDRKLILEHFLLGRCLEIRTLEENFLKAELTRLWSFWNREQRQVFEAVSVSEDEMKKRKPSRKTKKRTAR